MDAEVLAPSYRGLGTAEVDGISVHRFRYAPSRFETLTHDETAPDRVRHRPAFLSLVPGYVLSSALSALRLTRTKGYDVIHVHWPIPHAVAGLVARKFTGVPLVCTFHGVELTWTQRQLKPLMPFLRHTIRTADAVTANSSYTAGMIRQVHDRPVNIVPFGATVEVADMTPDDRADASTLELLFVGRLVERKGVHYLLDALAQLPDLPLMLRIVGDGPMREELERQTSALQLSQRVRFEGVLSHQDLAARFNSCDVFVLPAVVDSKGDVEGLGVVLIEALCNGKPVIASAAGGIVDIVKDGETGRLVPPGDANTLAAAIRQLARDPDLRNRLAEGGRRHVERTFSWPVIIERLAGLYRELANDGTHNRRKRHTESRSP